jgi:D-alanyl-D-alanine carboxypeptidase
MKRETLLVLFAALAALLTAAVAALPGHGQNGPEASGAEKQLTRKLSKTSAQPAPTDGVAEGTAPAGDFAKGSAFTAAATHNALLKTNLEWVFGGKQQRGWYLYTPLISRLIGTEKEADTSDFASALALWQRNVGLEPTGVLDDDTWYLMVSTWQSRRSKDRSYPQPDQLFTAPVSDFYDPTRAEELRKVELETYSAYKRMVAAAAADPSLRLAVTENGELAPTEKYLKIISSFRSREYQEHLRKQSPGAGRAGLAVNSPHFTGRALDIYVGGEDPVSTEDRNRAMQTQTRVYKWLVKNAERFGFKPYYYEPWHWEYSPR